VYVDIPEELTSESLDDWSDEVKAELDLWIFSLTLHRNGDIKLDSIIVKPDELKQGKGTKAMNQLIELADRHQRKLWLSPGKKDPYHKTTSRARLVRFYKRFGFIENKGRNFGGHGAMFRKPHGRRNPVAPLPSGFQDSIALMTLKEFLDYRNPRGKWHDEESYNFDLEDMNRNYKIQHLEDYRTREVIFRTYRNGDSYLIYSAVDSRDRFKLVAIIYENTLYYEKPSLVWRLPGGYRDSNDSWVSFNISEKKRIKYLDEMLELINNIKQENLDRYPYLHQRIRLQGESFQIRFEKQPEHDAGTIIAVLNSEGQAVAKAQPEWGATLVVVAQEYRGRGLGPIISQLWYDWNPGYPSGGFTGSGLNNATRTWENAVRLYRSKGWYSELLKQGHISKERLKEIFGKLSKKSPPKKRIISQEKKVLIYVERDTEHGHPEWGPTFAIYDEAFLTEPDEKHIYGFGFFRNNRAGTYLFAIDYEREFDKITTYVALQIARNNNEKIYAGNDYGADILELSNLNHVQVEEDYAYLTEDVLNLELFRNVERRLRNLKDPLGEKYHLLLEMAHTKWL